MASRRQWLSSSARVAALLASAGVGPGSAFAHAATDAQAAFDAKSVGDALKALGAAAPFESKDITLTGPDIAENGAVVPLGAASTLAGVKRVLLLVDKNPAVLSALFEVGRRGRARLLDPREDGPVVERLRGRDDGRRPSAVRAEGSQGHARRLRRLNGAPRLLTAPASRPRCSAPSRARNGPRPRSARPTARLNRARS